MSALMKKFMRRKIVDRDETSTQLHRVLTTVDLTMLGIGSTLGIGVYVLAGSVAKDSAGPAVVISFLVAAFASVLAGLCYAEFGARVPKAGSAYVYSYVCVGELIAFIVGWNLIMEYVIGVASVAKGYSGYVDQLFDHQLSTAFNSYLPIKVGFLSDYFDVFAFSITLLLTFLLAFGVKESSLFNNIFTVLNLGVVLFVVIAGSLYADPKNWMLTKEEIFNTTANITADKVGEGGFAPFGFHGIMKGAATCFYGFVGFDCIATTGEEAKNPKRAIPLSIIFSLIFIFLAYFGISTVVTMMVPYYLQDAEAPLPQAFAKVDFTTGQWIVTIGALFGLSTSLLGAMFPMPRVIYAMSSDGVLFKFLSKVHPRFQTPLIATLLAGTFGGLMAAIFRLEALIDMMSIGTLTAYTLVAICVLCLRYRKDVDGADDNGNDIGSVPDGKNVTFMSQIFNSNGTSMPTDLSSSYTNWAVILYCILTVSFCAVAIFAEDSIIDRDVTALCVIGGLGFGLIFTLVSLSYQPVSRVELSFKVPYVPLVPGLSILANTYLIMKLSGMTWVRFSVWMGIGFLIYAICLLNGTTDRSYKKSVDKRNERNNRRKYSKISASGFENKGLNNFHMKETANGGPIKQNGTCDRDLENASSAVSSSNHFQSNSSTESPTLKSITMLPIPASKLVETEIIEKTIEFYDNSDDLPSPSNEHVHREAEKAAMEAIDSVISEACEAEHRIKLQQSSKHHQIE